MRDLAGGDALNVQPFSIQFSETQFEDLRRRVMQTDWPQEIPGSQWEYGVDLSFLMNTCAHWAEKFDWAAQVARFATFHHYRYSSSGLQIHFIHERGKGPHPLPIVLTHGWPGSFIEMLQIIPMLADPTAHGADPEDAFNVIVPSLPGFGYSDPPRRAGFNVVRVAELWSELMTELGYDRFAAQGGDIGAGVSTALGLRHPDRLIGVHLNYIPGSYRPHLEPAEQLSAGEIASLGAIAHWAEESGAYGHMHRTRPQTLAYALHDSPVGLAAWILEKFRDWSDCEGDLWQSFSRDDLLANVTLYWMTRTISSSIRMYFENRKAPLQFRSGEFVRVPCAIAHFPKEIPIPAPKFVERGYNVQRWTEMPRGGHFAAMEAPEALAEDIRAFFRPLR